MIHLCKDNEYGSLCGSSILNGDVLTCETPPKREISKLCSKCKGMFLYNLEQERLAYIEARNNRPLRQKG